MYCDVMQCGNYSYNATLFTL